ncbi:MAG: hypothetical protein U0840_27490 [Gemmataceae bacterium]
MCLSLYIASNQRLPEVSGAGSLLNVSEAIYGPLNPVLQHVSKSLLYSVYPQGGCGCAFDFLPLWESEPGKLVSPDTPEITALRRALVDYLSAALRQQTTVEIYTCCSGDEDFPPTSRRTARPIDFIHDRTLFQYRELVVVSEADTALETAMDQRG